MTNRPSLGEILLGTEGLALLRLAFTDDAGARRARIDEIRSLLADYDEKPDLTAPLAGPEYDRSEGYALWSQTYDRPLRLFPIEEPVMHDLIGRLPPSTVLDAACGTGRYSEVLARGGHSVIGVDASAEMLARARPKVPGAEFREGELTALPLEDESVDAAVCALALVHLEEIDGAMREFARVLRPGGRLVISDVHPFPIMLGWQAQFRTIDDDAGFMRIHPHLLSEYSAAGLAAGLSITACFEPRLTPEAAMTPAAEQLPEANHAAWVGLPGVVIWEMKKSAAHAAAGSPANAS
ncbi:methyltransferase domain-containing protein [Hoeflea sp. WL0058]|uniref:Methyltransferase domain-containing protein n=1 Tax=Flavimaribacter sediminis TaxID=2865987 RepID=A0AAE2ZKJ0_9HYPH|nr:class I SAM-dependent methyltransferase [Flavimaribacter sediminis]MBW8637694.1 methyltransferase domain-containing protein [Flavimaribacter sediminis]